MGNEIPVIVQEDLMKKKKKTPGYFVPAGILKILEIIFCVLTLVVTEVGRWQQLITIFGYSDKQRTTETGLHKYWGFLPFGFYHAHIFALCILGSLAFFSLLLLFAVLLRLHACCGQRGFRYWLTIDFVYSVTGSCLSFIAFALLAVFCAYPEVWREHLFGGLYWRNVSNFVIIAAAVLAFVTMCQFIVSSIISGRVLNAEMKKPKPIYKKRRIIMVTHRDVNL